MCIRDRISSLAEKKAGKPFLFGRRQCIIFYTPVYKGDYNIGIEGKGLFNVGADNCSIEHVYYCRRRHFKPVGSICIVQNCNRDTVLFNDKRTEAVPRGTVGKCACMHYAQAVEPLNGAEDSFLSPVNRVIVGLSLIHI